ncbi:hypothetical protein TNCV_3666741 [Trichonephila clavipes]|nr:hypothetical protein TNCV_3666741 [Trichonephila clavipes]
MWNPQKAGYLLRNILGSKVVKTNLKEDFHIIILLPNAVMDMNDLKPTPKIARPLKETLAMFRKRAKTPTALPPLLPELQHASKKNIE